MRSNQDVTDPSSGAVGVAPPMPSALPVATMVAPLPATLPPAQPPGIAPLPVDGAFDVPATFVERMQVCEFLAKANLLPKALREQPANVMLIMHKALALSIPLSVALEHLHVIDGVVGHSAELLRALLYKHGHRLRWLEIDDKHAIGELTLRHDPKHPRVEAFTIGDATRMKLSNKDNWQKDPSSMLVARCTTRLVSRHCPEVAVALGNLSAMDVEDEPAVAGGQAGGGDEAEHRRQLAHELYVQAQTAQTIHELSAIGQTARSKDILDVNVDGQITLQRKLLDLIAQLKAAEDKTSTDDAQ
jgi:hypothetical protein